MNPSTHRSDRARALAARLVLAIHDQNVEAVNSVMAEAAEAGASWDMTVTLAGMAAARIPDEQAPELVAAALDRLAAD
ncbi:hypothetical protein ACWDTI_08715 [Gordonia sp. NPDC003424]